MKTLLTIISLLFLSLYAYSQVEIQWQNNFGEGEDNIPFSVSQTAEGGSIIAGRSTINDLSDVWVVKSNLYGELQWTKRFGGVGSEVATSIKQLSDGGYICAAIISAPGGDIETHYGGSDAWVVKLDPSGNIEWQRTYGGADEDIVNEIKPTNDGGFILCGDTKSYTEYPESEIFGGERDFWIIKLDSLGDFQWQRTYGGSNYELGWSISPLDDGNLIMCGSTASNDYDMFGNHGGYTDAWITKMDNNGDTIWTKSYGGSGTEIFETIIQSSENSYVAAGWSTSVDGDVSLNKGDRDVWVVKVDTNGNIIWQKTIGGFSSDYAEEIIQTSNGDYVLVGRTFSNDGDVSVNKGLYDFWVVKLNKNGEIIWEKTYGGSNYDEAYSICETFDMGYIVTGKTQSIDGDVLDNNCSMSFWILKIIEPNISGKVFYDENQNSILDEGEAGVTGHMIKLIPDSLYAISDQNGYFYFRADTGIHNVSYIPYPNWQTTNNEEYNVNLDYIINYFDTINIPVVPISNITDASIEIVSTPLNSGATTRYRLLFKNWGTETLSGHISFLFDPLLTYVASSHPFESFDAETILWNYESLASGSQDAIWVDFVVPGEQNIGDEIFAMASITPLDIDVSPQNNFDTIAGVVLSSFDPNNKIVTPKGCGEEGFLYQDTRLSYTISFQNTGNDTAQLVVLRDSLDINLDIETLLIEAYSHSIDWDIIGSREILFTFDSIMLPDSSTNYLESNGFVKYSISPKEGNAENVTVNNTTYIYFDYNSAIVTNTTKNTFVTTFPFFYDLEELPIIEADCSVNELTPPAGINACGTVISATHSIPLPIIEQGESEVLWTYDLGGGVSSTQIQNVSIIDDINPNIICIENQIINLEQGQTTYIVTGTEFDPVSYSDNCSIYTIVNDYNTDESLNGSELTPGSYFINWTITDIVGNTSSCINQITINSFVGINDKNSVKISIYPNPVVNVLNLQMNNSLESYSFEIISSAGELIYSGTIQDKSCVDTEHFASGMYLIKFSNGSKYKFNKQ